jgi:cyclase
MFRPRVIPVLLLHHSGLVKTIRFNKKTARYIGDPINAVRIFNELEADELMVLDITASIENRPFSMNLVHAIGDEAFMPFSVGGGIRSIDDVKEILSKGAEKVVINTASVLNPPLIEKAASLFGNQSIIVAVDIKKDMWGKYNLYICDGVKKVRLSPVEHLRNMENMGAGEILINFIDRDGIMLGYDVAFLKEVSEQIKIPLIACGGAGNLSHLSAAAKFGGASALAAGSLFVYHGERKAVLINYPEKKELSNLFNT